MKPAGRTPAHMSAAQSRGPRPYGFDASGRANPVFGGASLTLLAAAAVGVAAALVARQYFIARAEPWRDDDDEAWGDAAFQGVWHEHPANQRPGVRAPGEPPEGWSTEAETWADSLNP